MSKIDVSAMVSGLDKIVSAAQSIEPIAKALQFSSPVSSIIFSAIHIAENLLKRGKEGAIVMKSYETDKVQAILADLQAVNDRLNKDIEDS